MIRQIIGLKCTEIVELESFETLPEKDLQPWEKGRCQSSYCDVPFGFPPLCTWSWIPHPHIHHAFRACQCRMNLCYQVSSIITLFQLCQCLYTRLVFWPFFRQLGINEMPSSWVLSLSFEFIIEFWRKWLEFWLLIKILNAVLHSFVGPLGLSTCK